jgi:hypothetical protein
MDLDDRSTEMVLKDAAVVCGVTEKTLGRDRDERQMPMTKRDGRWWVTVGALIDHGRLVPTSDAVTDRLASPATPARLTRRALLRVGVKSPGAPGTAAAQDVTVPDPDPQEFCDDIVKVARRRPEGRPSSRSLTKSGVGLRRSSGMFRG